MTAEHLVEHHAQAVDVGSAVDAVCHACDLFWRHVCRGAADGAELSAARRLLVEGQPEVHEDRAAVGRQDDVRGLDIAVDGEPGVCMSQRIGHVGRDACSLVPARGVVSQPLREIGALEIIRNDVHLPFVQADVVDRHDAGVAQPREPAGLLEESLGLGVRHLGATA